MVHHTLTAVATDIWYFSLLGLYGGFTAVNYSVFLMPHSTDVSLTPPILSTVQHIADAVGMLRFILEEIEEKEKPEKPSKLLPEEKTKGKDKKRTPQSR